MRHENYTKGCGCPVEAALEVIGSKWKGLILFHLLSGTKRFSEIRNQMPKISQRTLTLQLRELESDGVIARRIFPEVPPKVEYSLTPSGWTLEPILQGLKLWGQEYLIRIQEHNPIHQRCLRGKEDSELSSRIHRC